MTDSDELYDRNKAVVGQMFAHLRARDFDRARAGWADSATWTVSGSHELAGEYTADEYLAALARWYTDYPSYVTEVTSFRADGEQGVMVHLVSRHGPAPGVASGWLLYRVVDDRIAAGWAVPTFGGGAFPF